MKPILFNPEMVRAILSGRKTVTRRVIKPKYNNTHFELRTDKCGTGLIEIQNEDENAHIKNPDGTITQNLLAARRIEPKYHKGDVLYVRETWKQYEKRDGKECGYRNKKLYGFKADENNQNNPSEFYEGNWNPSIHMPKEASRIFLKVTSVRTERLQDITTEQAKNEGVDLNAGTPFPKAMARDCHGAEGNLSMYQAKFIVLWDSTIKKQDIDCFGWVSNPWVWVIEFERVENPEGHI